MERALPRYSLTRPPDAAALVATLEDLRPALADHLRAQRWFRSKARTVTAIAVGDAAVLPLPVAEAAAALVLLDVAYADGPGETYLVPLAARPVAAARTALAGDAAPLARLGAPAGDWLLYDGLDDPAVSAALLRRIEDADDIAAGAGSFGFDRTPVLSQLTGGVHPMPIATLRRLRGEQSNTSLVCDDRLVLKVFRRLDPGENPDLELGRFLTLRARFRHVPQLAGFARYQDASGARTVAVLTAFVPNAGDGWTWSLAVLREVYAAARRRPGTDETARGEARALPGDYLAGARRLGEVTGALHVALASEPDDPAFAPEPVTESDLGAWGAAVEAQVARALGELRRTAAGIGAPAAPAAARVLAAASGAAGRIREAVARLRGVPLWKTRCHGDYHLGQVLRVTGATPDFVILDFEGEPARPLEERRAKHSPLRDVAGMLRSFTYASYAALFEAAGGDPAAGPGLEPWREAWESAAVDAFLAGYLGSTVERGVKLVPPSPDTRALLLSVFCLEKAAYELSYEINNRPSWLPIPLAAFERELVA
jgi:maltose alpha-D-glucosyltransferase/alpha-amylase